MYISRKITWMYIDLNHGEALWFQYTTTDNRFLGLSLFICYLHINSFLEILILTVDSLFASWYFLKYFSRRINWSNLFFLYIGGISSFVNVIQVFTCSTNAADSMYFRWILHHNVDWPIELHNTRNLRFWLPVINDDLFLMLGDLLQFTPTALTLDSGVTRPPPLLSEADLLSCMDKVSDV